MKVLVVSEGKHEIGNESVASSLAELVRRMLPSEATFETLPAGSERIKVHMPKGKAKQYEKRAMGWLKYASDEGYDCLIFVIDQDKAPERIEGLSAAQDSPKFAIPRAFGVAIVTYDAWMLADEQALTTALGSTVSRQQSPERMKAPKIQCKKLHDSCQESMGLAELYLCIAQCIDLDVLTQRCPRGFAPFRERVESVASH